MPLTVDELTKRRERAQSERNNFQPMLDDAFDYAVPYRKSARDMKGEQRVDRAYDQTAIVSAFRFAGKLQQDLDPTDFDLKPGELLPQDARDQLKKPLEQISTVLKALMATGEFDMAFHEMALDLSVSTGAMLILEGDEDQPARFLSAAIDEVLLLGSPYGDVTGICWTRKWTLRDISETFGEDGFSQVLKDMLDKEPEKEIDLHQDCHWHKKSRRWNNHVWAKENDKKLFADQSTRACPWITPRYFRVPGEVYGRGPVMLTLPTIKTLNTAQRLTLQSAAIAMLGIYTAIDDGVFNPDLSPLEPGAVWKVARNGGALGRSVERFPEPRIDLQNLILQELRMTVQTGMMDQSLPPDGAAVRSATEILERAKRLYSDHLGAFGRLVREIVVPTVKRLIEIAYNQKLIADRPKIDDLLTKIKIKSNIAKSKTAEELQQIIQWVEMVITLLQNGAGHVARLEDILVYAGEEMGVSERFIVTATERNEMVDAEQKQQLALIAAQAAAGQAGSAAGGAAG